MQAFSLDQLEDLFIQARQRPAHERDTFLEAACSGNTALRQELESLLNAADEADNEAFLDAPAYRVSEFLSRHRTSGTPPGRIKDDLSTDLIGRSISHYEIKNELGQGGMGIVYKARDHRLDRTVAIKFLPPPLTASRYARERFMREAKAASALDHPNICTIYDIGDDAGVLYLVMACYDGETIKQKILRGPLSIRESVNVIIQVLAGLKRAHEAGIVHRDIKPANIMVTSSGLVKILDFGIAKFGETDLTRTGVALGTVAYMSPEQIHGKEIDHRTDLWSVGVVLYEMLSGERPFPGETEQVGIYNILHEEPISIKKIRPEIPEDLVRILNRVLNKDYTSRYRDAGEFLTALQQIVETSNVIPDPNIPVKERLVTPAQKGNENRGWQEPTRITKPGNQYVRNIGSQDAAQSVPPIVTGAESIRGSTFLTKSTGERQQAVGREKEIKWLKSILDKSLAGLRQVVFISGEAGLGKTTLVETFLAGISSDLSITIGHGQCIEHRGTGEAYLPVLEALGRICRDSFGAELFAALEQQAPTWLVQMPGLVSSEKLEVLQQRILGATRERMIREMVEALEMFTAIRPLILILEDVHWSDPATLDLLSYLAQRPDSARLLVIATYRPATVSIKDHPLHSLIRQLMVRGCGDELSLAYLSRSSVGRYLDVRFPDSQLPTLLTSLVHERTAGNPLFMKSLVDAWIEEGMLAEVDGTWGLMVGLDDLAVGVPENLRQLIEQQVERLEPEETLILESASVAGLEFTSAVITSSTTFSEEEVENRCNKLARDSRFIRTKGMVEWPDGTLTESYVFIHHLYPEVLYERIPANRCVRLHRQIGQRLEIGFGVQVRERANELAMHFLQGRDHDRAIHYLQLAAELAFQRSAHQQAAEQYMVALGLIQTEPDTPERARKELPIQVALAPALVATRGWSSTEAEQAYYRARSLSNTLNDKTYMVPVLFGLGALYEYRGMYREAQQVMEERLTLIGEHNELLPESYELIACSTFHQGQFRASLRNADLAIDLCSDYPAYPLSASSGDKTGVSSNGWAALSLWFLGFPEQAKQRIQQALQLSRAPFSDYSLAHANMKAAFLHQCCREPEGTLQSADKTIEIGSRHGFVYRTAVGEILRGWALTMLNHLDEGIQQIHKGLADHRATGAEMDRPYFLGLLADALDHAGKSAEGLTHLDEALTLVRNSRTFFYESELHRLRGMLLLHDGADFTEVEHHLQESLTVARQQSSKSIELRTALCIARLWQQQGRSEEAYQLVKPIYDWFTEGSDTPDLLEADQLLRQPGAPRLIPDQQQLSG